MCAQLKLILAIYLLLEACGCGTGMEQDSLETELCNGYKLVWASSHEIVIECPLTDRPVIAAKVLRICIISDAILAERVALVRRSPDRLQDHCMIPGNGPPEYLILDTKSDQIYGPYGKTEFMRHLSEAGIAADDVKLVDVSMVARNGRRNSASSVHKGGVTPSS